MAIHYTADRLLVLAHCQQHFGWQHPKQVKDGVLLACTNPKCKK